ncbi:AAA family ATPase [Evansella cellulosilytica]|uniref:AAA ATPase central domain protein n=1 Tax=Evansella cellulosilytica (strain ATCC 21833 / DSM 2522 / FERM P-1141 / JCM 9156 / N-4) TaxID=649639 RepID=E6U236_EVAC2|nr:AAA family ATPase [Evansella cellulosilytica]ADU30414.1 AAA ATPase central domain protein [Evansella cellulosilytica DSM 2522]
MNKENHGKHIDVTVEEWMQYPYSKLKEAEIVRALSESEQINASQYSSVIKARLLAMAAVSRYQRKQSFDIKVETRINEAWEEKEDKYVCEAVVYLYSFLLNETIYKQGFPKIRETDHSQGKKKTIARVQEMIEEGIKEVNSLIQLLERYEEAVQKVSDNTEELVSNGINILKKLQQQNIETVDIIKQYESTISGIYFSKEKHKLFHEALEQLTITSTEWNEWQASIDREEEEKGLKKLHTMIGMEEVKKKVHQYYYYLLYQEERRKHGYRLQSEPSLNMILTGNPGTGKTELARLLANIYFDLGVLPREEVIEVDRSQLVGAYVGQTEEKTMNVIKEAIGGVLFIDEAYSLKRGSATGTDYGQTAIDTLVSAMTGEYAGQFAVIMAGYPEEMRSFLWSNPGLRSRFPESNHIHLDDYSTEELLEIGEQMALDNDFSFTSGAVRELKERIEQERVDESFGNARTVKNIVLDAIFEKGAAVAKTKQFTTENFILLDSESFEKKNHQKQNTFTAEEQLQQLIGLKEVKEQVNTLASFVKVQNIRKEKGLRTTPIQLHAIFTGPPGTGKTTVAKIYGQILYELGLLKRGHLVIAGRSDLVAAYVGQTAIKTKKMIKQALGGVLFIDEAYSLVARGDQDFGKEAVDTLVEEMTKHNENLVVILAGYDEKMGPLMGSNPGLKSRFKKTITFPHYSSEELVDILIFYVNELGYKIDQVVVDALNEVIKEEQPDGNARAMKDMVEDAIQRQAYRIIQQKKDNEASLTKLELDDFSILVKGEKK